jgi:hypothetical protein
MVSTFGKHLLHPLHLLIDESDPENMYNRICILRWMVSTFGKDPLHLLPIIAELEHMYKC